MANSPKLALPYLEAGQSQKHVTVNESLRMLDALVQLAVVSASLSTPPGSPANGAAYIVAAGGAGAWDGWDGDIAVYADNAWIRLAPQPGWRVWDIALGRMLVRIGAAWTSLTEALNLVAKAAAVTVAQGALGSSVGVAVLEETLTSLSGATRDSTITIPDRAICLGVSTRTTTAITGATSYGCGVSGTPTKFGGTLGIAAGSTNKGVIGPEAFYAATPIRLTANGGNFTGGAVRIAIHYLTLGLPS